MKEYYDIHKNANVHLVKYNNQFINEKILTFRDSYKLTAIGPCLVENGIKRNWHCIYDYNNNLPIDYIMRGATGVFGQGFLLEDTDDNIGYITVEVSSDDSRGLQFDGDESWKLCYLITYDGYISKNDDNSFLILLDDGIGWIYGTDKSEIKEFSVSEPSRKSYHDTNYYYSTFPYTEDSVYNLIDKMIEWGYLIKISDIEK